jgi:recombination protein RecR
MEFPSKIIEAAVQEFSRLPGVGKKTALRYVLHILRRDPLMAQSISEVLHQIQNNVVFCKECHNISDQELCAICSNTNRNNEMLCVVQDIKDVMAIESTGIFRGKYHVLGGLISPLDGIGPQQLHLETLIEKVHRGEVKEVILALSATLEGETTSFYIFKKLHEFPVTLSTLARGITIGDEIEYADEITLGKSLQNRMPYTGQAQAK